MYYPGQQVLGEGSMDFAGPLEAYPSPLAKRLFKIDGVQRVYFGSDFITITKTEDKAWSEINVFVFSAITEFFASGMPVVIENAQQPKDTAIQEGDSEVVIAIKEILESRIRPIVQDDGGDIAFRKFEDGVVYLELQGACSTCSSSTATLKNGIENMLLHYIPEVSEVREYIPEELPQQQQEQPAN